MLEEAQRIREHNPALGSGIDMDGGLVRNALCHGYPRAVAAPASTGFVGGTPTGPVSAMEFDLSASRVRYDLGSCRNGVVQPKSLSRGNPPSSDSITSVAGHGGINRAAIFKADLYGIGPFDSVLVRRAERSGPRI